MSYYMIFHSWSGDNPEEAAAHLARIFRMDPEEAHSILEGLGQGNTWQFPHKISENQSQIARNFLTSIGYEVECVVVEEGYPDLPGEEDTAEESQPVSVPVVDASQVKYVGFWVRFAAMMIDSFLVSLVMVPVVMVLGLGVAMADPTGAGNLGVMLLQMLLPALIFILFWRKKSATPGKMLFKAKIVDADTFQPLSTKQCVIRYIGYMVSSLLLGLGFLMVAFSKRKQGLHDLMAHSVVIQSPS